MSNRLLGTCGACGGRVTCPTAYLGIYPPVPCCDSCGRTPKNSTLPVIDMNNDGGDPVADVMKSTIGSPSTSSVDKLWPSLDKVAEVAKKMLEPELEKVRDAMLREAIKGIAAANEVAANRSKAKTKPND